MLLVDASNIPDIAEHKKFLRNVKKYTEELEEKVQLSTLRVLITSENHPVEWITRKQLRKLGMDYVFNMPVPLDNLHEVF